MKILLLGEYSNVHATLAEGLRMSGYDVTVASNGDFWKNYPRDIDLARKTGKLGGICLLLKVYRCLAKFRGYDVVQLINPMFLELKAERLFSIYKYLRKHNRRVFLGAYGMDYYWVSCCSCVDSPLRYSDFNIGREIRENKDAQKERQDWLGTAKERLNKMIANDCDGIVAGLYEYYACYAPLFPKKTRFIPFPITLPDVKKKAEIGDKVVMFIGINKDRSEYKGTDIMLKAAQHIAEKYPHVVELRVAESVPFAQYQEMLNGSDVILDQLYSYTPAMNALMAMSKGIVVVGGGEEENYEILGEKELRPIINVLPTYESVVEHLEWLVTHKEQIPRLKEESVEYIKRHHEYIAVAQRYVDFWNDK